MANIEQITLLKKNVHDWNARRKREKIRPDLTEADLSACDLEYANLADADLSAANLREAKLLFADLRKANLRNAVLRNAQLGFSNLSEANLSGADLCMAGFVEANLCWADLRWSFLYDASLREANLKEANLIGAVLRGTNLRYADLTGSQMGATILSDVDIQDVVGLEQVQHSGPSTIGIDTVYRSQGRIPELFLLECGVPDHFIEFARNLIENPIELCSCFISYSAKDDRFVKRLLFDLRNKGVRCYYAPHDLPIGAKIWDTLDEAIRLSDKLLVVLSAASIRSDWVEDEVSKGFAEERSRNKIVLLPVRIDNIVMSTAEPWAVKLRDQRNIADFRHWRRPLEYRESLNRLLRDLRTATTE